MVSGNPEAFTTQPFAWLVVLFLIFVLLDTYFGMYISIKNSELIRTNHFFVHHIIPIQEIKDISYKPTWIIGGGLGYSLRIHGSRHRKPVTIEIANAGFSESTLSNIAHELQIINPKINFDERTKGLARFV
jgi:hypothetical protein